jgi:hypothetical protein
MHILFVNQNFVIYFPSLYNPLDLARYFSYLIVYTIGRTPWTREQPIARLLPRHRTTKSQNKRTQTSMTRVEFELTTLMFERGKTGHALDQAATVIGVCELLCYITLVTVIMKLNPY